MNKAAMTKCPTIALLGQPNSGKSTLFNGLTGARQRVGNWPGKTVEKKEGYYNRDGARSIIQNSSILFICTSWSLSWSLSWSFLVT
jgi:predicted GTPase